MKNKNTLLYIGNHSEIADRFVDEGYLVNQVFTSNTNHFTEHIMKDGEPIKVARDSLEGDARVIIMDADFLSGVIETKSRIELIIRTKLKSRFKFSKTNDGDAYPEDKLSEEIEKILSKVGPNLETLLDTNADEASIDKAVDNFFTAGGSKYISLIMEQMSKRDILGHARYDMLQVYIEQMKVEAANRIKDSRYESGEQRDQLEGDARWKPILLLTTNDEYSELTIDKDVSSEYLIMDFIKEIFQAKGLEMSLSGVVNTKTTLENGMSYVEAEKISKALRWARFLDEAEEKSNKDSKEFFTEALEIMDILDVNGGIVNHLLRSASLMKFLLESVEKDSNNVYSGEKIPKNEWKAYIIGALFHDNGKLLNLSRPDLPNFLPSLQTNASRNLPTAGFDAVRVHAELGGENIQAILDNPNITGNKSYLDIAKNMAYYHQEFFIGDKGYSINKAHDDSLEEVPLEAQYMAIPDVMDAIVGRRNYNPNGKISEEKLPTIEDAIGIMARQAGIMIKIDGKTEGVPTGKQWCLDDKIKFERKGGYFLDNSDVHFNQNLLMCFFEAIQKEAVRFREGKKTKTFEFNMDKETGRLTVESIGGIGFEQFLHRDSIKIAKTNILSNPSKLGEMLKRKRGMEQSR